MISKISRTIRVRRRGKWDKRERVNWEIDFFQLVLVVIRRFVVNP